MIAKQCFKGFAVLSIAALSLACGGEKKESGSSIAKALEYESAERKAAEEAQAKEVAEAKAKREAEESAVKALEDAITAAAVAPPNGPKSSAKACDGLIDAYDTFMRAQQDDKIVLDFVNGRKKSLGGRRANCLAQQNPQLANCIAAGLGNAPKALFTEGEAGARRIIDRCADKYGGEVRAAVAKK